MREVRAEVRDLEAAVAARARGAPVRAHDRAVAAARGREDARIRDRGALARDDAAARAAALHELEVGPDDASLQRPGPGLVDAVPRSARPDGEPRGACVEPRELVAASLVGAHGEHAELVGAHFRARDRQPALAVPDLAEDDRARRDGDVVGSGLPFRERDAVDGQRELLRERVQEMGSRRQVLREVRALLVRPSLPQGGDGATSGRHEEHARAGDGSSALLPPCGPREDRAVPEEDRRTLTGVDGRRDADRVAGRRRAQLVAASEGDLERELPVRVGARAGDRALVRARVGVVGLGIPRDPEDGRDLDAADSAVPAVDDGALDRARRLGIALVGRLRRGRGGGAVDREPLPPSIEVFGRRWVAGACLRRRRGACVLGFDAADAREPPEPDPGEKCPGGECDRARALQGGLPYLPRSLRQRSRKRAGFPKTALADRLPR